MAGSRVAHAARDAKATRHSPELNLMSPAPQAAWRRGHTRPKTRVAAGVCGRFLIVGRGQLWLFWGSPRRARRRLMTRRNDDQRHGGPLMLFRVIAALALSAGVLAAFPFASPATASWDDRYTGGGPTGGQGSWGSSGFSGFSGGFGSGPISRSTVSLAANHAPGTIIINTSERRLYYVLARGQALRYGIGVGRIGFTWSGVKHVSAKREWPAWTPPAQMLRRRPDPPRLLKGGLATPLGPRALYPGC